MNNLLTKLSVGLLTLGLASATITSHAADVRMSERAQAAIAAKDGDKVKLILTYRQPPGLSDEDDIKGNAGKLHRSFRVIPGHAIEIPAKAAEKLLQNNPNIAHVSLDEPLTAASTTSLPTPIGHSYPEIFNLPYTGAGVGVAVIDSGVRDHPDLKPDIKVSFLGKTEDKYGHGNHVAGIIAGDGDHSEGTYRGVAPDAYLINLRVLDDQGVGLASDVIAALDWVLLNKDQYDIRVVNLSLGHPVVEPAATDPLVQAVEAVWDAGVVVVASAGNAGHDGYGTITSPGNSPKIMTVGSLTHWGDEDPICLLYTSDAADELRSV